MNDTKRQRNPWMRRAGFGLALVAAFALGLALRGGGSGPEGGGGGIEAAEATTWTCSMHPQIQLPEFGACPLCGMDLIPMVAEEGGTASGDASLSLSERAQKLADIQTTMVRRDTVRVELRMTGELRPDETRTRTISAWVPGRIDRLYVDFTGEQVRPGQRLFDLYSPEVYSAQDELLQAMRASVELQKSGLPSTRASAERTIEAAREKLRLWGLTAKQIEEIESRGSASERVTIVSPTRGVVVEKAAREGMYVQTGTPVYAIADLSKLWLMLDAYESDLSWLATGQAVEFDTEAYPGERFEGSVAFVDPVLDPRSRTVKVRVEVPNPDGRLRPGMFARAELKASVGAAMDEMASAGVSTAERAPLVIPASAPLITGKRAVVYVADQDEPGRFHGREVVLGPRAGDMFVVREGLEEGERVVTRGAFKIDSALQIQAKNSMMNPRGPHGTSGGASSEMAHGGAGEQGSGGEVLRLANVPGAFHAEFEPILGAYYEMSYALSHDDLEDAKAAAATMGTALSRSDGAALAPAGEEAVSKWVASRKTMTEWTSAISQSTSMEVARDVFFDLSNKMIETVKRFGSAEDKPVLVFHCPMAFDGAGADWLQWQDKTENPYYGSKMFRCGSRTDVLVASGDGIEPGDGGGAGGAESSGGVDASDPAGSGK